MHLGCRWCCNSTHGLLSTCMSSYMSHSPITACAPRSLLPTSEPTVNTELKKCTLFLTPSKALEKIPVLIWLVCTNTVVLCKTGLSCQWDSKSCKVNPVLCPQLVSRKGLSRSLFTATKKWFGGGKVPEKSISEPKSTFGLLWAPHHSHSWHDTAADDLLFIPSVTVLFCSDVHVFAVRYPPEAPELQIRKMADLCFLVQHYELAYNCYHTAKKDFLSDQAMLYAAGALVRTDALTNSSS